MAADLHIHIVQSEQDKRDYIESQRNTLGSKYFAGFWGLRRASEPMDFYHRLRETPHIWVGEVSWLKAGLTDDPDTYVPSTVGAVYDVIGEDFPVLDDALIARLMNAWELPNTTGYDIADPEKVRDFLRQHIGKPVFTISW